MKIIRFRHSNITVNWTVVDSDGYAIDLTAYSLRFFYVTGAGREEAKVYSANASGVVTWSFPSTVQKALGNYSLLLLLKQGERSYRVKTQNVFRLSDAMYEYQGDVELNVIGNIVETDTTPSPAPTPTPSPVDENTGLILRVCTEDNFGDEFDKLNLTETFNAHAIEKLHERLANAEALLGILQLARYTVFIWCSHGSMIMRYGAEADLTAEVWRDYEDITNMVPSTYFSWKRSSANAAADAIWNSQHVSVGKTIHITREDVNKSCTFYVEIPLESLINLNI